MNKVPSIGKGGPVVSAPVVDVAWGVVKVRHAWQLALFLLATACAVIKRTFNFERTS
jgi:hypothetical protein